MTNLSNCPSDERLYDGMQTLQTRRCTGAWGELSGGTQGAICIHCLSAHGAGVVAVVVMTSGEVTQRLFEREKVARIQIVTSEFNLERS